MTAPALSPHMAEALDRARDAGALVYKRGGYWVPEGAEPIGPHWSGIDFEWGWYAKTTTVKALAKRGLVRMERDAGWRFDSKAVYVDPDEPEPECTCAMTEASFRACAKHGENAPEY